MNIKVVFMDMFLAVNVSDDLMIKISDAGFQTKDRLTDIRYKGPELYTKGFNQLTLSMR